MFRLDGIDHVVLRVRDRAAAKRFYCEVLGCSIEREDLELGLIQLRAGASLIDLIPISEAPEQSGGAAPHTEGRNMDHFCLAIEPFDAEFIVQHLQRHGVVSGEIRLRLGAQGLGPSIYISDPDGNTVELKGPPIS